MLAVYQITMSPCDPCDHLTILIFSLLAMMAKTNGPNYLTKHLAIYLSGRAFSCDMEEGPKQYTIPARVPHGTALGPVLYSVMYNRVLVFSLPKKVTIIDFVNNLSVVFVAKQPEDVELYTNETISALKQFLEMVQLDLADRKTQTVFIISSKTKKYI